MRRNANGKPGEAHGREVAEPRRGRRKFYPAVPGMNRRDIIVIGASAGGVSALKTLFSGFDAGFPAAIFVVLHLLPRQASHLPEILQKQTPLRVAQAVDGEAIECGRAYVAPPDRHVVIEPGHLHLSSGPKENRTRPAINPLFRSAALAYGPRVIGVILSGILDDGSAGLWEIKRHGGMAVAQSPEDAAHRQMPDAAIANVHVDYLVPAGEMGALLSSLTLEPAEPQRSMVGNAMSEPTRLTCPDCHGPIQRIRLGPMTEYKCRVGHAYSPENMMAAHEDAEERALWSAIESLEEGADLTEEVGGNGKESKENGIRGNAQAKRGLARALREAIESAK